MNIVPPSLEDLLSVHRLLTGALHSYLVGWLTNAGLPGKFDVRSRTKDIDEARKKVARKNYDSHMDINDLSGLRVIYNFELDRDAYIDATLRAFNGELVVTRQQTDSDEFGYRSTHLEGTVSAELAQRLGNATFSGCKFEVQVSTLFQHAWSDVEHGLDYKGTMKLPDAIKRKLRQLAALVEVSDQILNDVHREVEDISRSMSDPGTRLGYPIDVETLSWFVQNDESVRQIDQKIAKARGTPILPLDRTYLNKLTVALAHINIDVLSDLSMSMATDEAAYAQFVDAYNARPRVKGRRTLPGKSVELYAEFRVLRDNSRAPEALAKYYQVAHGWPLEKGLGVSSRLISELGISAFTSEPSRMIHKPQV